MAEEDRSLREALAFPNRVPDVPPPRRAQSETADPAIRDDGAVDIRVDGLTGRVDSLTAWLSELVSWVKPLANAATAAEARAATLAQAPVQALTTMESHIAGLAPMIDAAVRSQLETLGASLSAAVAEAIDQRVARLTVDDSTAEAVAALGTRLDALEEWLTGLVERAVADRPPEADTGAVEAAVARLDRLESSLAAVVGRAVAEVRPFDELDGLAGRLEGLERALAELAARPPAGASTDADALAAVEAAVARLETVDASLQEAVRRAAASAGSPALDGVHARLDGLEAGLVEAVQRSLADVEAPSPAADTRAFDALSARFDELESSLADVVGRAVDGLLALRPERDGAVETAAGAAADAAAQVAERLGALEAALSAQGSRIVERVTVLDEELRIRLDAATAAAASASAAPGPASEGATLDTEEAVALRAQLAEVVGALGELRAGHIDRAELVSAANHLMDLRLEGWARNLNEVKALLGRLLAEQGA